MNKKRITISLIIVFVVIICSLSIWFLFIAIGPEESCVEINVDEVHNVELIPGSREVRYENGVIRDCLIS